MARYEIAGIWYFKPDDTDDEFYVSEGTDLQDIMDRAKAKWPNAQLSDIKIIPQHIHTDCLGYDQYDPGDYTNYLRISYNG